MLEERDLTRHLSEKRYLVRIRELQVRLRALHFRIYGKRIPCWRSSRAGTRRQRRRHQARH